MFTTKSTSYDRFKAGYGRTMSGADLREAQKQACAAGDKATSSDIAFLLRHCQVRG